MKRIIVLIGVLLLAGCATTEKEYHTEQGTKEKPISCARIYSNDAKWIDGKITKSKEPIGVILNYVKGKLQQFPLSIGNQSFAGLRGL